MRTLSIVVLEPVGEILLQFFQRRLDLAPEDDSIELIEDRFLEPFADPVGLRTLGLSARVLDVI